MEENTESITFVDVSESESKIKSEDVEQSSLQEKVDLENLVLFPSESQERTEEEHLRNLLSLEPEELFKKYENFMIKDEPSENEINTTLKKQTSYQIINMKNHSLNFLPMSRNKNLETCFVFSVHFNLMENLCMTYI